MTWHNNGNGIIEYRRRLISRLIVRKPNITHREVVEALGTQVRNPATGQPYALSTIHNDIQRIKEVWREKSEQDYGDWVAGELAKLDEAEAEAWSQGRVDYVIRCMERRAKLMGFDKPARHEIKHDWRTELIDLLQDGTVTLEQVQDELGDDLAKELFESAGIPIYAGGPAQDENE
jgi:hypothetical protein